MQEVLDSDLHAGLSSLELDSESFDLGRGITLSKTYAHLMAPFLMAFKPANPGQPHPAPWKAARGGSSFDVTAELKIPAELDSKAAVAETIVFLLRMWLNPAVTLTVFSNRPFADLANLPDKEAHLVPAEVRPRHFALCVEDGVASADSLEWIKTRWQVAQELRAESAEFSVAAEALHNGQFIEKPALIMISLWGALEAIFARTNAESRFRVSAFLAAFLEAPGEKRAALQKQLVKLYDGRSAAAHGRPSGETQDVLETFSLMRRVLISIIDLGRVPSQEELDSMLFGTLRPVPQIDKGQ